MKKLVCLLFVLMAICLQANAAYILIPMDEAQKNHLKAYGITYWLLNNEVEACCYEYSTIDHGMDRNISADTDYFTLFDFSAKWDPLMRSKDR